MTSHALRFTTVTAAAVACAVWVGCAAATAAPSPNVIGKKYGDASTALQQAGLTAVVASVIGDKLNQNDCVVVAQRDRANGMTGFWPHAATPNGVFVGAGGGRNQRAQGGSPVGAAGSTQVMLTLSCYAKDATPGVATGSGDINTPATKGR